VMAGAPRGRFGARTGGVGRARQWGLGDHVGSVVGLCLGCVDVCVYGGVEGWRGRSRAAEPGQHGRSRVCLPCAARDWTLWLEG
jgi:hypothetical protein